MDDAQLRRRAQLNIGLTLTNHWNGNTFDDRLFLFKKSGESMHHVAMKLLSFVLYYEPGLEIERSVGQHYKPDLVVVDALNRPTVWIDCGATSPKKLETIMKKNRQTAFVIVKKSVFELERYIPLVERRVDSERIRFVSFEDDFVGDFARVLNKRHTCRVVVNEDGDSIALELDGADYDIGVRSLGCENSK